MSQQRTVIDATALEVVLAGSMEQRATRIVEILLHDGEYFSYFKRPGRTVTVLGMFENHAVAVTDRGEFRKIHYVLPDPRDTRTLQLLRSEEVAVPVLDAAAVDAYVESAAMEAARAELDGDTARATRILEDIAPLVAPLT